MSKRRGRRLNKKLCGLYPTSFPNSVRWKVETDYAQKLSPAEKEWLAKFNDEFAGASFGPEPLHDSVDAKRELYRHKNAANKDAMELARAAGALVFKDSGPDYDGRNYAPTPDYLDSPEYRAALEEYRSHLPKGARGRVADTPEYRKARRNLERIVREHQAEDEDPDW